MKQPDYEGFAYAICQFAFDGLDADGGRIQELAIKHGIFREEKFDPEKHSGVENSEYFEEGDPIYFFVRSDQQPQPDTRPSELSAEEKVDLRKTYREAVRNCWNGGD